VVTYAQAQEIAEDWINAGVPRSRQREVRVREFDLGFVCWAVEETEGDPSESSEVRLVIARDSGASTLWPPLPVNEVVRQFEEAYGGRAEPNPAGAARPVPGAVEATSFLLSPPQWLQEAGEAAIAAESARLGDGNGPARLTTPPASGRPAGDAPTMLAPPAAVPGPAAGGGALTAGPDLSSPPLRGRGEQEKPIAGTYSGGRPSGSWRSPSASLNSFSASVFWPAACSKRASRLSASARSLR